MGHDYVGHNYAGHYQQAITTWANYIDHVCVDLDTEKIYIVMAINSYGLYSYGHI